MLDVAIGHIVGHLNQFLRRRFDLAEDIVVLANLVEQDGTVGPHIDNKVVAFLVNVEKDTIPHRQAPSIPAGADRSFTTYPPIYVNFHLMFASHFRGNNYLEALKFLSHTISFFQRHPVFDQHTTPDLDQQIDKLILGLENLPMHNLSTLWSALSGKYLPSVLYKVRMVAFDTDDIRTQVPTVRDVRAPVRS